MVLLIAYTYINYYLNSMAVIEDNKNVGNKILQYVYWKQSKKRYAKINRLIFC